MYGHKIESMAFLKHDAQKKSSKNHVWKFYCFIMSQEHESPSCKLGYNKITKIVLVEGGEEFLIWCAAMRPISMLRRGCL